MHLSATMDFSGVDHLQRHGCTNETVAGETASSVFQRGSWGRGISNGGGMGLQLLLAAAAAWQQETRPGQASLESNWLLGRNEHISNDGSEARY
jgi:hypothetical protein